MSTNATGPLLGYIYQIRYSLLKLLQTQRSSEVRVCLEIIDDVTLVDKEETELIQLKHSISGAKLSDNSASFWKTLFNWAKYFKDNDSSNIVFTMITNMTMTNNKIIKHINNNEVEKALASIDEIIIKSKSKANRVYFEYIKSYDLKLLRELLYKINIITGEPNISEIKDNLLHELRTACRPNHIIDLFESLEGYYFNKCIDSLFDNNHNFIRAYDIYNKIDELREQYKLDNLPSYDDFTQKHNVVESSFEEEIFVEQLKHISISSKRITMAIYDYYKAYYLRSRWIRNGVILSCELSSYENQLREEWQNLYYEMLEDMEIREYNPVELIQRRKQLYSSVMSLTLRIRDKFDKLFFMRGNYHILANNLEIGWNENFKKIFNLEED